jgi:hypothetical protein
LSLLQWAKKTELNSLSHAPNSGGILFNLEFYFPPKFWAEGKSIDS